MQNLDRTGFAVSIGYKCVYYKRVYKFKVCYCPFKLSNTKFIYVDKEYY